MDFLTPLLAIGGSFLSSLLGTQKNETASQSGTVSTNANQTANTVASNISSTSQDTQQTQDSTTGSVATTGQVQNQTQGSTGNVSRLDDTTKNLLTQKIQELLATSTSGSKALESQMGAVAGGNGAAFDPATFIKGIMDQAGAASQSSMESDLAKIGDTVGAGADTNSAAALLKARVNNDSIANLAGIRSQATQTAAEIARAKQESTTQQLTALAGSKSQDLGGLVTNLLNAGQTENSTVNTGLTGSTTANTNTTGKTVSTGKTNEKTTQLQTSSESQNSSSVQKSDGTSAGNTGTQDWTTFFGGLGKMLTATF